MGPYTCSIKNRHTLLFLGIGTLITLLAYAQNTYAQNPPKQPKSPDGITRFEKVTVKRVRPEHLPDADLSAATQHTILRPNRLPKALSHTQLKALANTLSLCVVPIVMLHTPKPPYRPIPIMHKGHAVWISAKKEGKDPVLVTTLDWVSIADELYLIDEPPKAAPHNIAQTTYISLKAAHADRAVHLFQQKKHKHTKLLLTMQDTWRNLAILKVPSTYKKEPVRGLTTFDSAHTPLGHVFGYSPMLSTPMVSAVISKKRPPEQEFAFYIQTSFPGILGAPLITSQGEVVALNAFKHPKSPELSLAIPPKPLSDFVRKAQGIHDNVPKKP